MKLAPLAVAVLDAGGHMIVGKREDGSPFLRYEIAQGKAWGSLGLGYDSRALSEKVAKSPSFFVGMSGMAQGGILPSPGGVLVAGADGDVIGAVGISGDTGDNDEACALAGLAAVGLKRK